MCHKVTIQMKCVYICILSVLVIVYKELVLSWHARAGAAVVGGEELVQKIQACCARGGECVCVCVYVCVCVDSHMQGTMALWTQQHTRAKNIRHVARERRHVDTITQ